MNFNNRWTLASYTTLYYIFILIYKISTYKHSSFLSHISLMTFIRFYYN